MFLSKDEGVNCPEAASVASHRIELITALLSFVTGYPWRVRCGPEPQMNWSGQIPCEAVSDSSSMSMPTAQPITHDLDRMLRYMNESEVIAGLVLSFAHALRLQNEAPSLCFLAYAAVVERVGSCLRTSKKCDCCDKCNKETGATEQFRAGLDLVTEGLSNTKRKKLARRLYQQRSTIAHSASLVGNESARVERLTPIKHLNIPPGQLFIGNDLPLMRHLCREVLARVFCDTDIRRMVIESITAS